MSIAPPNLPHPQPTRPSTAAMPLRRLAGLTAVVLGAHWLLLQGVPFSLAAFQIQGQANVPVFTTRTIDTPVPPPIQAKAAAPKAPTPRAPKAPAPEPLPVPAAVQAPSEPSAGPDTGNVAASTGVDPAGTGGPGSGGGAQAETGVPAASGDGTAAAPVSAASAPEPVVASAPPPVAQPAYRLVIPEPVRLLYDVNGVVTFAYTGGAEMVWKHDGANYTASLQITKFGFSLRNWTSKGALGPQGVAPTRFGDKGRSSEVAAHFQRDKGIVSFSKNAPDVALQSGAQDHLSAFFQLSALLAGDPTRFAQDTLVPFQAVNAHGSEDWVFKVGTLESLSLPGGEAQGIHLTREHSAQYDTKVEVWLAPALAYLPVRIRLSQTNGDFAELVWRSTQKAE